MGWFVTSIFLLTFPSVAVGAASEGLNEWADEDAGIEAVQKILDTLDDVAALQDTEIDPDVLISMLRDSKLHAMLQVNQTGWKHLIMWTQPEKCVQQRKMICNNWFSFFSFLCCFRSSFVIIISQAIWSHKFPSDVSFTCPTGRRNKSLSRRCWCYSNCHKSQVFQGPSRAGSPFRIPTHSGEWQLV